MPPLEGLHGYLMSIAGVVLDPVDLLVAGRGQGVVPGLELVAPALGLGEVQPHVAEPEHHGHQGDGQQQERQPMQQLRHGHRHPVLPSDLLLVLAQVARKPHHQVLPEPAPAHLVVPF